MTPLRRALLVLVGCLYVAPLAAAQDPPAPSSDLPVLLDGEEVFRVPGGYLAGYSAEERVSLAERHLLRVARDPFFTPGVLGTERVEDGVWIRYRDERLALVHPEGAAAMGMSVEERAGALIEAIEVAVERYHERRRPEEWTRSILLLLGATLLFAGAVRVLWVLHRWVTRRVRERNLAGRTAGDRRLSHRNAARLLALQLRGLRLARAVAVVLLALGYLQAAFAIVPLTRGYALGFLTYLLDPVRTVWEGFLAHVGDLFFVIVVVALAHFLLRGMKALLTEALFGALQLPGLPPDRAVPLYKLLRLGVIAITIVMIYPYIPGSSSAAFQGISLFAGALFTLGASSTASNFIGGMVLVFSGAYHVGDRLKIGEVVGQVTGSTLVLTRLRTPRNELVTFANSTVLNEGFVNYTSLAREEGLIIQTELTIGYDVPWRRVHALMEEAARRTEGVVEEPAPFVLQTSLNDFHVGYQINAYTHEPHDSVRIRSELHENLQDVFAEAEIEILSPGYSALRSGEQSAVPEVDAEAGEKAEPGDTST